VLFITETWLRNEPEFDNAVLMDACPSGYKYISVPRADKKGGGIAIIYKPSVSITKVNNERKFSSFEYSINLIKLASITVAVTLIYRPPHSFTNEASAELDDLFGALSKYEEVLILGDFNLQCDSLENVNSLLSDLLQSHNLMQHVSSSTHCKGNLLDLVFTRASSSLVTGTQVISGIADHDGILFTLNQKNKATVPSSFTAFRKWKQINDEAFHRDLYNSVNLPILLEAQQLISAGVESTYVTSNTSEQCNNRLVNSFETRLRAVVDMHAPEISRSKPKRNLLPWWNEDIRASKRVLHRSEKKWRSTKLEVHRLNYLSLRAEHHKKIRMAKNRYLTDKLLDCHYNSKEAWRLMLAATGKKRAVSLPERQCELHELGDEFNQLFLDKPSILRSKNVNNAVPSTRTQLTQRIPSEHSLSSFALASAAEVEKTILHSPRTSCKQDILPTWLLVRHIKALLPCITSICNLIISINMPAEWKIAHVVPLLKNTNLDGENLGNYRPISNLKFLSKVVERLIARRLNAHLEDNSLFDPRQSAYRHSHSCETALTYITDYARTNMDKGRVTIIALLDMSAAFDCVDHDQLVSDISNSGITSSACNWLSNYLKDRQQLVVIQNSCSDRRKVRSGVPQGSVLGPLLFSMYLTGLGEVIRQSGFDYMMYADDVQIFAESSTCDLPVIIAKLEGCISLVCDWLAAKYLVLNGSKTEFILIGQPKLLAKLPPYTITVSGCVIPQSSTVRNLGVILDESLTMKPYVNKLRSSSYSALRLISRIRQSLNKKCCTSLVRALVLSQRNYCASLLTGISLKLSSKLDAIVNSSLRLIENRKKRDSVSDLYAQLSLLPTQQHICYRLLLLLYSVLATGKPVYLSSLIERYRPTRSLRTQDKSLLLVPFTRTVKGDSAFRVYAAKAWNALPESLHDVESYNSFRAKIFEHLSQTM
jgi:hypothetical protein